MSKTNHSRHNDDVGNRRNEEEDTRRMSRRDERSTRYTQSRYERNPHDHYKVEQSDWEDKRYYTDEASEDYVKEKGRYNRDYRSSRSDNDMYSRDTRRSDESNEKERRKHTTPHSYDENHHGSYNSNNSYQNDNNSYSDTKNEENGKKTKAASHSHKRNRSSERDGDDRVSKPKEGKKFEEVDIEELLKENMPSTSNVVSSFSLQPAELLSSTSSLPIVPSPEPQIVSANNQKNTCSENDNNNDGNNREISKEFGGIQKQDEGVANVTNSVSDTTETAASSVQNDVKPEMNCTEMLLNLLQQQQQTQQQLPNPLMFNPQMAYNPMMPFLPPMQHYMPPLSPMPPPFFTSPLPMTSSPQPAMTSNHSEPSASASSKEQILQESENAKLANTSPSPQTTTSVSEKPAAQSQLPSVEDFVPVVPRSLIGLVHAPASQGVLPKQANSNVAFNGNYTSNQLVTRSITTGEWESSHEPQQQPPPPRQFLESGINMNNNNTNSKEPRLSLYAEKLAREARRVHISGFPQHTSREELMDFFRLLIPDIRRVMTSREMKELAIAAGDNEDEIRHIPANALTDLDVIDELNIHLEKSRPYGFLEMSLADIVTEMIEECARDNERFLFTCSVDNKSYPILFKRPRDYQPMNGVDTRTLVMIGYPSSLPEEKLRAVFENFGPLDFFESLNGRTCATFSEIADAQDCRLDFHGECLGLHMVILLPLYDWLKVSCIESGFHIPLTPDDPLVTMQFATLLDKMGNPLEIGNMSAFHGAHAGTIIDEDDLLVQDDLPGNLLSIGYHDNDTNKTVDNVNANALVLKSTTGQLVSLTAQTQLPPIDLMKDLLEMKVSIPLVVLRLIRFFNHLRPRFGSYHVSLFPTRILVLLNLFDEDELIADDSYSSLVDEIENEVEQHGLVEELIIPRREGKPRAPNVPKREDYIKNDYEKTTANEEVQEVMGNDQSDNKMDEVAYAEAMVQYERAKQSFQEAMTTYLDRQLHPVWGGYGRVFVVYSNVDEAAAAQQAIAGKQFASRTVITSFLFEDLLYPTNNNNKNNNNNNIYEPERELSEERENHQEEENNDIANLQQDNRQDDNNNADTDNGSKHEEDIDDELEELMNDVDANDLDESKREEQK